MSRNPRFLRPAVLAVLALGAVVSIAANVAVAQPTVIGRAVAGWPPIALVIVVDLISRVPTSKASVSWVRRMAAVIVGGIAAWMSYGHMSTLAARAGADDHMAAVFPLTVDGLIIVASLCLTELQSNGKTAEADDVAPAEEAAPVVPLDPPTPTTAERVLALADEHPEWTRARLAREVGVSPRTVRRYLTANPASAPDVATQKDAA